MTSRLFRAAAAAALIILAPAAATLVPTAASAQQGHPDGSPAQRQAIAELDFLDGEWRGEAVAYGPGGRTVLTQTERVGSLLGGSVKIVEGRGYDADGATRFNALGVISWDEAKGEYVFSAWSSGQSGDYWFQRTATGFRWGMPAGPNARIEYEAVVQDDRWREVGDYIMEGRPPMRFIEMNLTRIGDSAWPGAGAVSPR